MADYKVTFKASVDKDLKDLPKNLVARVWQRFELLKQQPFPDRHSNSKAPKACTDSESETIASFTVLMFRQEKSSFTMFGIGEKCIEACDSEDLTWGRSAMLCTRA